MVYYCAVALCTNGSLKNPGLSFHAFPGEKKRRRMWKIFCRRADQFEVSSNSTICCQHFKVDDFKRTLTKRRVLKPTAFPSIFQSTTGHEEPRERDIRAVKRRLFSSREATCTCIVTKHRKIQVNKSPTREQLQHNVFQDHSYCFSEGAVNNVHDERSNEMTEDHQNPNEKGTQTELTGSDLDHVMLEVDRLTKEIGDKPKLKRKIFVEDVTKNDATVNFYTGISTLKCLMAIFHFIQPLASKLKYWDSGKRGGTKNYQRSANTKKPGKKRTLSLFEEFLLTLVRLRLGLLRTHLSHIFGISESQVSKIFVTWVTFLAHELKQLIVWPTRQQLKDKLPQEFNKFPNTTVIIDCTEIFIEKPTLPSAQKTTWSEYKGHNTMKTLVGITPTGTFSYISNFWSGSTSDRKITQGSGFLDMLHKGDEVMADKGFNVQDLLLKKKAKLNIPPLAKGKVLVFLKVGVIK